MTKSEQIKTIRKHYDAEMDKLAEKYKVHSREGMPQIYLYIMEDWETNKAAVLINWGSCGSQSIEYTIKFQQYMKEVIELANAARLELIHIKAYLPTAD